MNGGQPDQLTRLKEAVDALGVQSWEEFKEAITPDEETIGFLRKITEYLILKGAKDPAYAVPYDVALALLLRSRSSDMSVVSEGYRFGKAVVNDAFDYALRTAQKTV